MRQSRPTKKRPIDVSIFLNSSKPTRWVPQRKAAVVLAVRAGLISLTDAYDRYAISADEFAGWEAGFDDEGLAGLYLKRRPRIRGDVTEAKSSPGYGWDHLPSDQRV
jgi:hypothetical protein